MFWKRTTVIGASVMAVFLITALAYAANGADDPPTTTSTSIASAVPAGSQVSQVDVVGEDDPATHDINDDNGVDDPATDDINDDNGVDDPATHDINDDNGGQDDDDPAIHDINDDNGGQVGDSVG